MQNMMSVDLEDYYCDLPFETWKNHPSRVVEITNLILKLFEKYNVSATFFTVGFIAEKHPELIEHIISKGHEISSHSFSHQDIRKLNPDEFELDLVKSIKSIEHVSKEKVLGFRAPFFSVNKKTLWVINKLQKHLKYDSSIFPTRTPLYGIPDAPRHPYFTSDLNPLIEDDNSDFLEIPLATLRLPILGNIPIAGGFHLRFLPLTIINSGIKKLNKSKTSTMCYIHPKDLDPYTPRLPQYNWTYYWRLESGFKKFESLLKNFSFSSVRDVFKL